MTEPPTDTALSWSDWPAKRRPKQAAAAWAVIGLTVLVITWFDVFMAVLGLVVLLTVTAEVLLPTEYRLSDEGVRLRNPLRRFDRPWSRFASWRPVPEGYFLEDRSPVKLLRRRRSVTLRWPEQREALGEALRGFMGADREGA